LLDERRHHLALALPGETIRLDADPTRLEQVLWNLLNNSAKYSEPGGRIALSVERHGDEVVVRVRDSGMGIKAEMLPRIFDMFVQVGEHKDHAQGGLGIGLSLVRTLVEMHGGSITARSDGPGRGSEFTVRLPVLPIRREVGPPKPDRRREPNSRPPRRRILVVDDNIDAAKSLGMLLGLYGQDVRLASDGPEALCIAGEFRPEVVVLDIGLPGMDGNEVARRLRERPDFQSALIIAVSGWGQETDRERSRAAGFDHHLVKPAKPDVILNLIAKTTKQRN
jgi:CheY-like chemotaxis protein